MMGEDVSYLDLLNKTKWEIESVRIFDQDGAELEIEADSYNYGVASLMFFTAEDELMWIDGRNSYHFDALTIGFYNLWPNGERAEAPILRTASGFTDKSQGYYYIYEASLGNEGSEKIQFDSNLNRVVVINEFYSQVYGFSYKRTSELVLIKY